MQGYHENLYHGHLEINHPYFPAYKLYIGLRLLHFEALCYFVIHWFIIQIKWLSLETSPGGSQ